MPSSSGQTTPVPADGADVTPTDARSLAASLEPTLIQTTDGRLRNISWFKTDWQRGGAATATADYRLDDGTTVKTVVKLPVSPRELVWTRRLQTGADDQVAPRLFASGDAINGYDLAWVVIEWFPHGPLGARWHVGHVDRIADAAARFCRDARSFPVDREPRIEDWHDHLRRVRESLDTNRVANHSRWSKSIRTVAERLDHLVEEWNARPVEGWIHGDLHIANAMSRVGFEEGPVHLIDLAEVRPGHWIEDAVYLERLFWAMRDRIRAAKPVRAVARARKAYGLTVETDYPRLAMVRRALLAATAPRFMKSEGDPRYLDACLEQLDAALGQL